MHDKEQVESMIPMLPKPLQEYLNGEGFKDECRQHFMALDRNGDGA